jgi:peptidoglycan hydrolase-like protein with peptidoglycan-binding domain
MPGTSSSAPAYKSYFFGKGYKDLAATISAARQGNRDSVASYWKRGTDTLSSTANVFGWLYAMGFFGAALSVLVFGPPLLLVLVVLHTAIITLFVAVIFAAFTLVAAFEGLVRLVRRLVAVCPHCHHPMPLPVYRCPGCGAEHSRLAPSAYGILFHQCKCGTRLPCTLFTNRGRLSARCPNDTCKQPLSREHSETPKQFLAIVGGPHVGKSAFLFAVTRDLREHIVPRLGMTARFVSSNQERVYKHELDQSDHGSPPEKTDLGLRTAFDLVLLKRKRPILTLYLYDHAGESFLDNKQLVQHRFLDYLSGIVFLVDPFAFPQVAAKYAEALSKDPGVHPGEDPPDEMLARLFSAMEEAFDLSPSERIRKPIAVVINKVDACGLEQEVGEEVLDAVGAPTDSEERNVFRNEFIRGKLSEWGQAHFVQQLEMRFTTVNFYTASALGRSPDRRIKKAFHPKGVVDPVLWILGRSSRIWVPKVSSTAGQRRGLLPVAAGALAAILLAVGLAVYFGPKIGRWARAQADGEPTSAYVIEKPIITFPNVGRNSSEADNVTSSSASHQREVWTTNAAARIDQDERALSLNQSDRAQVQSSLAALGYYGGTSSGIFDAETREAIRAFQRSLGHDDTGYLDDRLHATLQRQGQAMMKVARTKAAEQALALDSSGWEKVQKWLRAHGRDEVDVTGTPDENTRLAIRALQSAWNLPVTGHLDGSLFLNLKSRAQLWSPRSNAEFSRAQWKDIQQRLHSLGFDPGAADGIWGNKTERAIKTYQKTLGALNTGRMSLELYDKLEMDASN